MKGQRGGTFPIERNEKRRSPSPSPLHQLHFDREDRKSCTGKNKDTIDIHDIREWTKGNEDTSIKTYICEQVSLQKRLLTREPSG